MEAVHICNLYSITRAQDAMRQLFTIARDLTGNLPPLPAVFPDQMAPIVRASDGERQLEMMRWGMPGPPQFGIWLLLHCIWYRHNLEIFDWTR